MPRNHGDVGEAIIKYVRSFNEAEARASESHAIKTAGKTSDNGFNEAEARASESLRRAAAAGVAAGGFNEAEARASESRGEGHGLDPEFTGFNEAEARASESLTSPRVHITKDPFASMRPRRVPRNHPPPP